MAMDSKIWFNRSQPQTLMISQWLLYANAVLGLLFGDLLELLGLLGIAALVGMAVAAFGIANEQKWGYYLGVALGGLNAGLYAWVFITEEFPVQLVIGVMFAVGLFVALIHPQSREYQRIWFK
jgi:hypothetical protein